MKKEDARVARTKEKLFTAFTELLSEKTFEEITINEICIRSDIRRATFYKHFNDKYDFLVGLTRELRCKFEDRFHSENDLHRPISHYYLEYLRAMVDFLDRNHDIVKFILDSNLAHSLVSLIIEENYQRTKEKLDEDVKNGLKLIASTDTVAIYLAGGICHAIIRWVKNEKEIPIEEFINQLNSLISAVFVK